MDIIIESLRADWESFLRIAPRLVYGLTIALIFWLIGRYSGRAIGNLLHRTVRTRPNARFFAYATSGVIASVGALLALGVMGFHGIAASLLATGGIVAIIIGFAFREVGENFLAGLFLTLSRPFEIGDLIKTGDLLGEVRSIELRNVHLRTFDGCDVYVPSAQLFREALFNYTQDGLRRPSFSVGIAYHEIPEDVIALLEKAVSNVADVLADPGPFVTVENFIAAYIEYEVFFWIDVTKSKRGYVAITNAVKIACWRALRDAGMTFSTDVTTALEIKSMPAVTLDRAAD